MDIKTIFQKSIQDSEYANSSDIKFLILEMAEGVGKLSGMVGLSADQPDLNDDVKETLKSLQKHIFELCYLTKISIEDLFPQILYDRSDR